MLMFWYDICALGTSRRYVGSISRTLPCIYVCNGRLSPVRRKGESGSYGRDKASTRNALRKTSARRKLVSRDDDCANPRETRYMIGEPRIVGATKNLRNRVFTTPEVRAEYRGEVVNCKVWTRLRKIMNRALEIQSAYRDFYEISRIREARCLEWRSARCLFEILYKLSHYRNRSIYDRYIHIILYVRTLYDTAFYLKKPSRRRVYDEMYVFAYYMRVLQKISNNLKYRER